MTRIPMAGVYEMPDAEYHADPAPEPSLSSTLGRTLLAQSPLHAWTAHPRLNPNFEPVQKKTFDIGRAAHRVVLGAGADYAVYPDDILGANGAVSTKAAKEWDAEQRENGITPIKREQEDALRAMESQVHQALEINRIYISPDDSERVALAEIGGVWCRAMIDNAPPDPKAPLYDFKTCENADPSACERAVMNYGYDFQAAHYLEVWEAATGERRPFRFIFQEKSAPHAVTIIELSPDTLAMARKRTARAREIWRNCVRSGHWPSYPPGVHVVDLPAFYQEKWLDRESIEADHRQRTGRDILDFASRWQSPEGVA